MISRADQVAATCTGLRRAQPPVPAFAERTAQKGRATTYHCGGTACGLVTEPAELVAQLT